VAGAASGVMVDGSRVREGGTWRRSACGGKGELRGGPGVALHGGSTAAEQGDAVGATGRGKKGCSQESSSLYNR
jgi:hypothetical protein